MKIFSFMALGLATAVHGSATKVARDDASYTAISDVIASISAQVSVLNGAIAAVDLDGLLSDSGDLVALLQHGATVVQAQTALTDMESAQLADQFLAVINDVDAVITALIGIQDPIVQAGLVATTVSSLQDQLTATVALGDSITPLVPEEYQFLAAQLSGLAAEKINRGISFYQAILATSTTTAATSTTTSSTTTTTTSDVTTTTEATTTTAATTTSETTTTTEATTTSETTSTTTAEPTTTTTETTTTAETTTTDEPTTSETSTSSTSTTTTVVTTPTTTTTVKPSTPVIPTSPSTTSNPAQSTPCVSGSSSVVIPTSTTSCTTTLITTGPSGPSTSGGSSPGSGSGSGSGGSTTNPSGPLFTGAAAMHKLPSSLGCAIGLAALVLAF